MANTIPVHIMDTIFPSINQARLHYTAILHQYDIGQRLSAKDRNEIADLISAAPPSSGIFSPVHVTVVVGRFGRRCFELTIPDRDETLKISMVRSIKQHVGGH